MTKKILICLLVLLGLFTFIGCGNKNTENISDNENIIIIQNKDKNLIVSFRSIDDFKYRKSLGSRVENEKLGLSMTLSFEKKTKEEYDNNKKYDFNGDREIKEYIWNNYEGYSYGVREKDMNFRVLLEVDGDNVISLYGYVLESQDKDARVEQVFESEEVQRFLNTIQFKKN